MAEKKDVLEGTPMRPESKDLQAGAQDALSALNLIVGLARDGFQTYQTESTKREYLRTLRGDGNRENPSIAGSPAGLP